MTYIHAAELQGDVSPTGGWDWRDYIKRAGLTPAPRDAFFNQPQVLQANKFRVGHLIRAKDIHGYQWCLAKVEEVSEFFVKYVYLGKEDSDRIWILCDDWKLKPLLASDPVAKFDIRGCVAPTGVDIVKYMPVCAKLIKEGENDIAPDDCFGPVLPQDKADRNCFQPGQMLLAFDDHQEAYNCLYPAMITKVDPKHVWLTFPGWGSGADIKLPIWHRCLFPFELAEEMKMLSYEPVELQGKPIVKAKKAEVKEEAKDDGFEAVQSYAEGSKLCRRSKTMQKEIGAGDATKMPTSSKIQLKNASAISSKEAVNRTTTQKRQISRQRNAAIKEQELGVTSKVDSLLKMAVDESSKQLARGLPAKRLYSEKPRQNTVPQVCKSYRPNKVLNPPMTRPVNYQSPIVRLLPSPRPPPPAANFVDRIVNAQQRPPQPSTTLNLPTSSYRPRVLSRPTPFASTSTGASFHAPTTVVVHHPGRPRPSLRPAPILLAPAEASFHSPSNVVPHPVSPASRPNFITSGVSGISSHAVANIVSHTDKNGPAPILWTPAEASSPSTVVPQTITASRLIPITPAPARTSSQAAQNASIPTAAVPLKYRVVLPSNNMPKVKRAQPFTEQSQSAGKIQYSATITTVPLDPSRLRQAPAVTTSTAPIISRIVTVQPSAVSALSAPIASKDVTSPPPVLVPVAAARTATPGLGNQVVVATPELQDMFLPVRGDAPIPPPPPRRVIRIAATADLCDGSLPNIILINGDRPPVEYAPITYIVMPTEEGEPIVVPSESLRNRPIVERPRPEEARSSRGNSQVADAARRTEPDVIYIESSPEPEEIVFDPIEPYPEDPVIIENVIVELAQDVEYVQSYPPSIATKSPIAEVQDVAPKAAVAVPTSYAVVLPKQRTSEPPRGTVSQNVTTGQKILRPRPPVTGKMSEVPPTADIPPSQRVSSRKKTGQAAQLSESVRQSPRRPPAAKANSQSSSLDSESIAHTRQTRQAAKRAATEKLKASIKQTKRVVHVIPDIWDTTSSDETLEMEPSKKKARQTEQCQQEENKKVKLDDFVPVLEWKLQLNSDCYPGPYLSKQKLKQMKISLPNLGHQHAMFRAINLLVHCSKYPEKVQGMLKTVPVSKKKRYVITGGNPNFPRHIPALETPVESYLYLKEFLFRLNACPKLITLAPHECKACDLKVIESLEYRHRTHASFGGLTSTPVPLDHSRVVQKLFHSTFPAEGDLLEMYGNVPTVKQIALKFKEIDEMCEQFIENNNISFEYLHMLDDQVFTEILPQMSTQTLDLMCATGLEIRDTVFRQIPAAVNISALLPPYSNVCKNIRSFS